MTVDAPHLRILDVGADRQSEVTQVLCAAFHDYPVMRYVVEAKGSDYDGRLSALVGFFVQARFLHGDPVLAIADSDRFVAAATLTPPGERKDSPESEKLRQAVWDELGAGAQARYARLCDIWGGFWLHEPHYHVNMIGVEPAHQGRGLARLLLDRVHDLSSRHPDSLGVSLTTEDPRNVHLYEHFGYRVTGHARLGDLETWNLFRGRT